MKKLLLLIVTLATTLSCFGQFRGTNGLTYPYASVLSDSNVFIIGVPGLTNKNVMWRTIADYATNIAQAQADTYSSNAAQSVSQSSSNYSTTLYNAALSTTEVNDVPSTALALWDHVGALFTKGSGADIDAYNIRCATTLKLNGRCFVYYGANDTGAADNVGKIAALVGPSFSSLTKIGSVLNPTNSYTTNHVQGPRIYTGDYDDTGLVYMTFFGGTNTGFETPPNDIFIASSSDGFTWKQYPTPIWQHNTAAWNSHTLWRPFLVKEKNLYYLFSNGAATNATSVEQIGVAIATNIFGPYTNYSGNPVIPSGGLIADPSIVRTKEHGWLMAMNVCCSASDTVHFATSSNLLTWTALTNTPVVRNKPATSTFQAVELFWDDGLCMLYDSTTTCYLARPADSLIRDTTIVSNLVAKTITAESIIGTTANATNTLWVGVNDVRFVAGGAFVSVLPTLYLPEPPAATFYVSGWGIPSTTNYNFWVQLQPDFVGTRTNITVCQRWLTTNATTFTSTAGLYAQGQTNWSSFDIKIMNTAVTAPAGTNVWSECQTWAVTNTLSPSVISVFLGTSPTAAAPTNQLWWLGANIKMW